MTEHELIATNVAALSACARQAAEAAELADAEARRRQKARTTTIATSRTTSTPPPVERTVEQALERLHAQVLVNPIKPSDRHDPRTTQAVALLGVAGLPIRHQRRIPPNGDAWNCCAEKLTSRLRTGYMIALCGVQGTGKTQLASALIHAATDRLIPSKYAVAMDFFIDLKQTFDSGAKVGESTVIRAYTKPALLVLDEMDERSESQWENRLLFHMLNIRYNNLSDTLLISRRPMAEFKGSLGASVQSRILESGGIITCDWPSFRISQTTNQKEV